MNRCSRNLVLACTMLGVLGSFAAPVALPKPSEYDVKAALVYKIAKFVAWPERVGDSSKLSVCHWVARDAERSFAAIAGQTVGRRSIAVRPVRDMSELRDCQILYVGATTEREATDLLRAAATGQVLTIGESPEFAARTGVMALRTDARRVRFEINLAASRRAGLQIHSQLLGLATLVETPAGNGRAGGGR
jgi:hypothetical protein